MSDLKQVAEMAKNSTTKVVFSVTDYKGETYVDIREHVSSATYTGFTKKGIRLHSGKLAEFVEKLAEVKAALPKGAAASPPHESNQ